MTEKITGERSENFEVAAGIAVGICCALYRAGYYKEAAVFGMVSVCGLTFESLYESKIPLPQREACVAGAGALLGAFTAVAAEATGHPVAAGAAAVASLAPVALYRRAQKRRAMLAPE